ncbi:hypothetical protein C8R47DRAFT_303901 [Mycena vitilis]|nr:hypothetical protein C8R47DRAFT_303901 [Mycena vitilis]
MRGCVHACGLAGSKRKRKRMRQSGLPASESPSPPSDPHRHPRKTMKTTLRPHPRTPPNHQPRPRPHLQPKTRMKKVPPHHACPKNLHACPTKPSSPHAQPTTSPPLHPRPFTPYTASRAPKTHCETSRAARAGARMPVDSESSIFGPVPPPPRRQRSPPHARRGTPRSPSPPPPPPHHTPYSLYSASAGTTGTSTFISIARTRGAGARRKGWSTSGWPPPVAAAARAARTMLLKALSGVLQLAALQSTPSPLTLPPLHRRPPPARARVPRCVDQLGEVPVSRGPRGCEVFEGEIGRRVGGRRRWGGGWDCARACSDAGKKVRART